MDTIDRRNLLAVSGLALALAGCSGTGAGSEQNNTSEADDDTSNPHGFVKGALGIDPSWNIGFNPKNPHPGIGAILGSDGNASTPGTPSTFNPDYVAVLHFELVFTADQGAVIKVRSAHCATARTPTENSYATNEGNIGAVINYFNGITTTAPRSIIRDYAAFERLKFNAPHHVAIYFKNFSLYSDFPIIFGAKRIARDASDNPLPGSKNASFFDTSVYPNANIQQPASGAYNRELIYTKNYFHHYDEQMGIQPISGHHEYWYAMNLVTTVAAAGSPALKIPLIFDPDTGNMGGGTEHP